ncbi:hypothetical protein QF037_000251 [Streptomyces canus]|uniref:hypothetical protein n=1 Tax=Streptomyces canus TaxID=58343 RepID=UPI002783F8B4|nr:hypothetical protein [Streptomyces canus]MDQ0595906.1 hypothetical protein [Streptomyces canus]
MDNSHSALDRAQPPAETRPGVLVRPRAERGVETERWLLSGLAGAGRDRARMEWQELTVTLLPLGRHFAVVRIPGAMVRAAAASHDRPTVNVRLAECLRGPVIHDPGFDRYYALVLPGSGQVRTAPGMGYLGDGAYLGVPRTDHTELDQESLASYWAVPITRPHGLCSLAAVCEFALLGHVTADGDDLP